MSFDARDHERADEVAALQLIERIAVLANEAQSFSDAVMAALAAVCEYSGWPLGHAYFLGPLEADELAPTSLWHGADGGFETFRRITEATPLRIGVGLPGRVAQ